MSPGGSSSVCLLQGMDGFTRWVAAWLGQHCDACGYLGPPAAQSSSCGGTGQDPGRILGTGTSLVAWQWVTAWARVPGGPAVCHAPCLRWRQAAVQHCQRRRRRFPGQGCHQGHGQPHPCHCSAHRWSIQPCPSLHGSSRRAGCRHRLGCGSCAAEPRAQKPFCL